MNNDEQNKKKETSLVPVTSQDLERIKSSLTITNKLLAKTDSEFVKTWEEMEKAMKIKILAYRTFSMSKEDIIREEKERIFGHKIKVYTSYLAKKEAHKSCTVLFTIIEQAKKEQNINIPKGQIEEVFEMKDLYLKPNVTRGEEDIKDLTPLSKFSNLEKLYLENAGFFDNVPIAELTNLKILMLFDFPDLSILSGLNKLEVLSLGGGSEGYSALGKLKNLKVLDLNYSKSMGWNNKRNLSFLKNLKNLTQLTLEDANIRNEDLLHISEANNLEILDLRGNKFITDISALENLTNLRELYFEENRIKSIAPLTNLKKLKTLLILECRYFTDITPLQNLKQLEILEIRSKSRYCNFSIIKNLTNLKELYLGFNYLINIDFMSNNLSNLEIVNLMGNNIKDITPLLDKKKMKELDLSCCGIYGLDITPIKHMTSLERLFIYFSGRSDVSSITGLSNLKILDLHGNEITDISPLMSNPNIERLYLNENKINKIDSLGHLYNLKFLNLGSNEIDDITPLANLKDLEELNLADNKITDISPLYNLPNLKYLNIETNSIPKEHLVSLQKKLPNVTLKEDFYFDF